MKIYKLMRLGICSLIFPLFLGFFPSCNGQNSGALPVIFETDMGNDVDDALALAMLFRYADQGKVNLLGISSNKQSLASIQFLDVMRKYYGYGKVPLGTVQQGVAGDEAKNFARKVMDFTAGGQSVYNSDVSNYNEVMSSVKLYRKLLSAAEDTSVVIISVGFSTNLSALLASEGDRYSDLNGEDLVAKKVKFLSVMAGNFAEPKEKEFNIKMDISAANDVFSLWPTRIYVSPFAVGSSIRYPATSIEANLRYEGWHPLVTAYKKYLEMPYDRQTWDLTSVLYAVEPEYFDLSQPGVMEVDEEGYTWFKGKEEGRTYYLELPDAIAREKIKARFVELIEREEP